MRPQPAKLMLCKAAGAACHRLWCVQVSGEADGAGILLSVESKDKDVLQGAVRLLKQELPEGIVASTQHNAASFGS